jgi:glycine/serine hydroxymethyltransferase
MSAQVLSESALRETDPKVKQLLEDEFQRQSETICLIPSENTFPKRVLEAMGERFYEQVLGGLCESPLLRGPAGGRPA